MGDLMLGRYVAEAAARTGYDAPFEPIRPFLGGDLALANLESPLTARRDKLRPGPYRLPAPPEFAPALAVAGFDALSLANNHALDAGAPGLADTIAALDEAGVAALGAGGTASEAFAPVIREAGGVRLALLAFNDVVDPEDGVSGPAPADDSDWANPDFAACPAEGPCAGRAWLSPAALEAVSFAAAQADAVVVLVHWGVEYASEPNARQQDWAARLVAAGADLVLGAHPHVTQPAVPVEAGGRQGFVAYSLGNAIFDGPPDPALNNGLALRALIDTDGVALVALAPMPPATVGATDQSPIPPRVPLSAFKTWRWDGAAGIPVDPPADLQLPPPPTTVSVDLRGDGEPVWAELDSTGVVRLRETSSPDAPLLWQNELPAWRFQRIVAGDPNDDGRAELLMLLWQPDDRGELRSQPYILGWRSGRYQIIWGGSATATPIQDLRLADFEGDGRSELVVLEGGSLPGDPGEVVSVWRWHGWGFQLEWRSERGHWEAIALRDLDGDGRPEILAGPQAK